jgi:Na+-translocating ferredoxin:NAD+ oxidoreductase RnfD subunit
MSLTAQVRAANSDLVGATALRESLLGVGQAPPTARPAPAATASAIRAARRWDPRLYQIATLSLLLIYGILWLDLEVRPFQALAILGAVLLAQFAGTRLAGLPRFDPRSALISGLSLCLILKTNDPALTILAAAVAIASKFTLRLRGKHIFNPTNFALVTMMLVTGQVWVSPGQWGSVAIFAFLLASAGGLVVNRAARGDVTWAFLACYVGLVLGRSVWLGEPPAIPLHRLQNGALILFSFFMISDPKTTPDSRAGRILFACMVAVGAYLVQFALFRTNGLLWSLAVCSLAVPLIDRLFPGPRYQWCSAPGHAARQERRLP